MNLKKRLLKLGCISLLLLSFVGYFAFSTFVFSPLEGRSTRTAGLIRGRGPVRGARRAPQLDARF